MVVSISGVYQQSLSRSVYLGTGMKDFKGLVVAIVYLGRALMVWRFFALPFGLPGIGCL